MKNPAPVAVYWDPTSVLSALFKDSNSEKALSMSKKEGVHFFSTLCYAQVCSVLNRIKKEKKLKEVLIDVAFDTLKTGPWRRLNIWPKWAALIALSEKWPLKSSSLWHLASAKTLQKQLSELTLFTFDEELKKAAREEGLLLLDPL
jgi:predicted nucleic acid-binding protein